MKVRVEFVGHQEKIEAAVTISVTSVHLLVSKRESTQDSAEYDLAIWAVNLFDVLGSKFLVFLIWQMREL